MIVALSGTPHLWIAGTYGQLHWGGDTRALQGKHIDWSNRRLVILSQLLLYPIGDPWLSAGLLKIGDPIYLVKWEVDWPQPKLLHIKSIKDVELFGINGGNYGSFVLDKAAREQRYGIDASSLPKGELASAVPSSTAVHSGKGKGSFRQYLSKGNWRIGISILTGGKSHFYSVTLLSVEDDDSQRLVSDFILNPPPLYEQRRTVAIGQGSGSRFYWHDAGLQDIVVDCTDNARWTVSFTRIS